MRYILVVIGLLWPMLISAQTWEDQQLFKGETPVQTLRVLSSTDTGFFSPIIQSFLAANPDWNVEYLVTGTADISAILQQSPQSYDVVISSAMDLQVKLVNDGFALKLPSISHPDWAQWRQSLFAFTSEPATIVVNRSAFRGKSIPANRQELIRALREAPEVFDGKLGTYDVRSSGVGYLFATQDARASETFWRLMEVMGGLKLRLYCCSGDMIDHVASGELLVAYNVLGSYAAARQLQDDRFEIILPSDFPTTMMRTGFVSKETKHPVAAERFVRHLVEGRYFATGLNTSSLPQLGLYPEGRNPTVIPLEPALMTYLDKLKRGTFIQEWSNAVIQ